MNPPSLDDFKSYAALGKSPPPQFRNDADFLHRWQGLSVYDTLAAAYDLVVARDPKRKRWPCIGVLHIPDDAPIIYEGPGAFGHWNLYDAAPSFLKDECLAHILRVETVADASPD
jgi:hypothetical protein